MPDASDRIQTGLSRSETYKTIANTSRDVDKCVNNFAKASQLIHCSYESGYDSRDGRRKRRPRQRYESESSDERRRRRRRRRRRDILHSIFIPTNMCENERYGSVDLLLELLPELLLVLLLLLLLYVLMM